MKPENQTPKSGRDRPPEPAPVTTVALARIVHDALEHGAQAQRFAHAMALGGAPHADRLAKMLAAELRACARLASAALGPFARGDEAARPFVLASAEPRSAEGTTATCWHQGAIHRVLRLATSELGRALARTIEPEKLRPADRRAVMEWLCGEGPPDFAPVGAEPPPAVVRLLAHRGRQLAKRLAEIDFDPAAWRARLGHEAARTGAAPPAARPSAALPELRVTATGVAIDGRPVGVSSELARRALAALATLTPGESRSGVALAIALGVDPAEISRVLRRRLPDELRGLVRQPRGPGDRSGYALQGCRPVPPPDPK